ncbi:MAG: DNA polymerase III subunit delta' [Acidimicrobiales bacterium]
MSAGLYTDVVGQEAAVRALRAAARSPVHAYLLVGPAGTGVAEAASSFAASLLCPDGGCGSCDVCRRVLLGVHPDLIVRERTGPYITVADAREIGRLAALSPVEARRKVMVLVDFHLVQDAAPALLKAIEEPPPTTVFVVLAEQVQPPLVTIASRCVQIDFAALAPEAVAAALVSEGVDASVAAEVAAAAGGRLDRARLLVTDPRLAERRALWRSAPVRLDGTGAAAAVLAEELVASLETVVEPLRVLQAAETVALDEEMKRHGLRSSARTQLEARHKREERRLRTDELRFGLATLAAAYRDRVATGGPRGQAAVVIAEAVSAANRALEYNPNVVLLLQSLLVQAGRAGGGQ